MFNSMQKSVFRILQSFFGILVGIFRMCFVINEKPSEIIQKFVLKSLRHSFELVQTACRNLRVMCQNRFRTRLEVVQNSSKRRPDIFFNYLRHLRERAQDMCRDLVERSYRPPLEICQKASSTLVYKSLKAQSKVLGHQVEVLSSSSRTPLALLWGVSSNPLGILYKSSRSPLETPQDSSRTPLESVQKLVYRSSRSPLQLLVKAS